MNIPAIKRAINIVGNQSRLARALGVSPQSVQQWLTSGHVPAKRAVQIEQATSGAVTRTELRPDLYEQPK